MYQLTGALQWALRKYESLCNLNLMQAIIKQHQKSILVIYQQMKSNQVSADNWDTQVIWFNMTWSDKLTANSKRIQDSSSLTHVCTTDWLHRQLAQAFRRRRRYSVSISILLWITKAVLAALSLTVFSRAVIWQETCTLALSVQHKPVSSLSNGAQMLLTSFSATSMVLLISTDVNFILQTTKLSTHCRMWPCNKKMTYQVGSNQHYRKISFKKIFKNNKW